jgi:hypothetical protein
MIEGGLEGLRSLAAAVRRKLAAFQSRRIREENVERGPIGETGYGVQPSRGA